MVPGGGGGATYGEHLLGQPGAERRAGRRVERAAPAEELADRQGQPVGQRAMSAAAPSAASCGGIGAGAGSAERGTARAPRRCRRRRSPSRLPRALTSAHEQRRPAGEQRRSRRPRPARGRRRAGTRSGPASSRTVRSPRASLPSDLPRVSVSSVVGTATSTATVATSDGRGRAGRRRSERRRPWRRDRPARRAATSSTSDVDQAGGDPRARRSAGGRSSATASPVTRSSSPSSRELRHGADIAASTPAAPAYSDRVDLDAYVLAHAARVGAARGADAPAPARPAPRPTSSSSATSGSPPTCRWSGPPRRTPRWWPTCPRCWPAPGPRPPGTRTHGVARRRRVLHRPLPGGALPAALVVARRRSRPTSWSPAVMMAGGCSRTPACEQSLLSPSEVDQLVNHDFEGYYSEYAAVALRRRRSGPTTPGSPRSASRSACSGCRWSTCCFQQHRSTSRVIGSIMIGHGRGGAVLRADPAARAARADRGLRRRRRRAAAVLVVGRARAAHPAPVAARTRGAPPATVALGPGRGAARQRRHRGLRDAVRRCRPGPGSGSASLAEAAFLAYVFVARPPRRTGAATPATSTADAGSRTDGRQPAGPADRRLRAGRAALQHQVVVGQPRRQLLRRRRRRRRRRGAPSSVGGARRRSASTCSAAAASYTVVGVAAARRPSGRAPGRATEASTTRWCWVEGRQHRQQALLDGGRLERR